MRMRITEGCEARFRARSEWKSASSVTTMAPSAHPYGQDGFVGGRRHSQPAYMLGFQAERSEMLNRRTWQPLVEQEFHDASCNSTILSSRLGLPSMGHCVQSSCLMPNSNSAWSIACP